MSIAASGSVHSTTKVSPAGIRDNAFLTLRVGSGHLSPRRLRVVSVISVALIQQYGISSVAVNATRMLLEAMRIVGLAGWSGAGKTTLLARILPRLIGRGLRVSTVKHAHHNFDLDLPGKDSHTHRLAGATEVLVSSANRWALMHELRGADEPLLGALLNKLTSVDLVVVEGFKHGGHPKLEVYRESIRKPLLHPEDPRIFAIVTDAAVSVATVPLIRSDDFEAIVDSVIEHAAPVETITGD